MRFTGIFLVARNEFALIIRHPMVIIIAVLLMVLILINSVACSSLLPQLKIMGYKEVFTQGWSNQYSYTLLIISFLSLCIGIISIAGERSKGSMRLLLTKPIYRKHVIVGKLMGINMFLLMLNMFASVMNIALIMIFYSGPDSMFEIFRIGIYAFIMFIFSALTSGLMVFFSLILKGLFESLTFAVSYLYMTWYVYLPESSDILRWINPVHQCKMIIQPWLPFTTWIETAIPVIVLLSLETIVMVLACCAQFNREEI
jgi:ABC-2 type transport system permease protein